MRGMSPAATGSVTRGQRHESCLKLSLVARILKGCVHPTTLQEKLVARGMSATAIDRRNLKRISSVIDTEEDGGASHGSSCPQISYKGTEI